MADKTKWRHCLGAGIEIGIAAEGNALQSVSLDIGVLSPFTCPECHGVLSKIMDGKLARYRCHTGHAYSVDTLMIALTEKLKKELQPRIRTKRVLFSF